VWEKRLENEHPRGTYRFPQIVQLPEIGGGLGVGGIFKPGFPHQEEPFGLDRQLELEAQQAEHVGEDLARKRDWRACRYSPMRVSASRPLGDHLQELAVRVEIRRRATGAWPPHFAQRRSTSTREGEGTMSIVEATAGMKK